MHAGDSLLAALRDTEANASAPVVETAPPLEPAKPSGRFVLVSVADSHYAVPEGHVTEVDRVPKITLVPLAPAWLLGVANLRGDVLSVIDLRTFLGLEPTPAHSGRIVIVRLLDEEFATGLLVDAVGQIVRIALDEIRPPASPLEGPLAPYMTGFSVVGDRLVGALDLERLLRAPEIRQFDDRREVATGA